MPKLVVPYSLPSIKILAIYLYPFETPYLDPDLTRLLSEFRHMAKALRDYYWENNALISIPEWGGGPWWGLSEDGHMCDLHHGKISIHHWAFVRLEADVMHAADHYCVHHITFDD